MDNIVFKIKDYNELLSLHKALIEAKFHINPDNEIVPSSPIVAKLCNDTVDLLSKENTSWNEWRSKQNDGFFMG